MKLFKVVFVALFTITLFGCSSVSTNQFLIKKAPEIIIPHTKTVAIKSFDLNSSASHSNLPDIHKTDLELALLGNNAFELVSNGAAEVTVSGVLSFIIDDDNIVKTELTDSMGNIIDICRVSREGKLQVKITVNDNEGEIIGISQFNEIENSSASGSCGSEVHSELASPENMLAKLLKKSIQGIVYRITPSTEDAYRTLAVAENKKIETANELAKNGSWEQAYESWVIAESGSVGSKVASYYNQSIYFEKIGNLNKANQLVQRAITLKPEKRFVSRQNLLSKLMAERNH